MPPLFRVVLMLAGAALLVETICTPGFQFFSSIISGGLIGWNFSALLKGE